jgi:hypothetical protein
LPKLAIVRKAMRTSVEEQFSRPWRDFLWFSFPGTCFAACRATFSRALRRFAHGQPWRAWTIAALGILRGEFFAPRKPRSFCRAYGALTMGSPEHFVRIAISSAREPTHGTLCFIIASKAQGPSPLLKR